MDSHYTDISNKYDYLFEPIHQANTSIIISKLQLTPDDLARQRYGSLHDSLRRWLVVVWHCRRTSDTMYRCMVINEVNR